MWGSDWVIFPLDSVHHGPMYRLRRPHQPPILTSPPNILPHPPPTPNRTMSTPPPSPRTPHITNTNTTTHVNLPPHTPYATDINTLHTTTINHFALRYLSFIPHTHRALRYYSLLSMYLEYVSNYTRRIRLPQPKLIIHMYGHSYLVPKYQYHLFLFIYHYRCLMHRSYPIQL